MTAPFPLLPCWWQGGFQEGQRVKGPNSGVKNEQNEQALPGSLLAAVGNAHPSSSASANPQAALLTRLWHGKSVLQNLKMEGFLREVGLNRCSCSVQQGDGESGWLPDPSSS